MQSDKVAAYRIFFNYLHLFFACSLLSSLLFYFGEIQYFSLIGFFMSYPLDYCLDRRWKSFSFNALSVLFLSLILFWLMIPLWHFAESTDEYFHKTMEYRLAFAGFGLVGLLGENDKFKLKYFAIVSLSLSVLVSIFLFVSTFFCSEQFPIENQQFPLIVQARLYYVNNHMVFNMFLNVSVAFGLFYLLDNRKYAWLVLLSCLLIFVMLFFSEGRAGFLGAVFLILLFVLKKSSLLNRKARIAVCLLVVLSLSVVVLSHDRLSTDDMRENPRVVLWNQAVECIKEKPVFGYGVSDGEHCFITRCMAYDEDFVRSVLPQHIVDSRNSMGFHAHSVYLQSMLEFGVFGLLLQVFILAYPMVLAIKRRNFLLLSFCALFAIQGAFDVWGVGLLPVMFSLLMLIAFKGERSDIYNSL